MRQNWVKRISMVLYRLLAIFIFLIFWEIVPRLGLTDTTFLPPFSQVAAALWKLAASGELFKHIIGVGFVTCFYADFRDRRAFQDSYNFLGGAVAYSS